MSFGYHNSYGMRDCCRHLDFYARLQSISFEYDDIFMAFAMEIMNFDTIFLIIRFNIYCNSIIQIVEI